MKTITGAAASTGDSVFLVTAHYDGRIRIWTIDFAERSLLPADIITFSHAPIAFVEALEKGRALFALDVNGVSKLIVSSWISTDLISQASVSGCARCGSATPRYAPCKTCHLFYCPACLPKGICEKCGTDV
jgi:hypothetical protein